jgi:hypothetical protein
MPKSAFFQNFLAHGHEATQNTLGPRHPQKRQQDPHNKNSPRRGPQLAAVRRIQRTQPATHAHCSIPSSTAQDATFRAYTQEPLKSLAKPAMSVPALRALLQQDDYTITLLGDGTGVLTDLRKETLLALNSTAALIVAKIDDGASEDEIVAQLVQKYDTQEAVVRADVKSLLVKLAEAVGMSRSAEH